MGLLDFLFKDKTDIIKDFKERGAIILDVRTKSEYNSGAILGSKHIPLQSLESQIKTIKKFNKPIITCCASGMRSGSAANILQKHGIEVVNGGSWTSLNNKL